MRELVAAATQAQVHAPAASSTHGMLQQAWQHLGFNAKARGNGTNSSVASVLAVAAVNAGGVWPPPRRSSESLSVLGTAPQLNATQQQALWITVANPTATRREAEWRGRGSRGNLRFA